MSAARSGLAGGFAALRRFAVSSLVTTALGLLVRLAKNVLFTRLLGPEARGIYGLLLSVPAMIVGFGNLGFGLGSVYLAAKEKADLRALVGNALVYVLIQGTVLCLVGVLLYQLQDRGLFTLDGAGTIRLAVLVGIPLMLAYNLGLDLLMGAQAIHSMNLANLAFSSLPLAVMLVWFAATGDALTAAGASWLVSLAAIAVFAFGRLLRLARGRPRLSLPLAGRAFGFGLRGCVAQFTDSIIRRVDVLFLAHYWSAAEVGQYAAAVSVAEILLVLPEAVAMPFLPIRLGLSGEDGKRFSATVIKYVLAVMVLVCAATALLAKPAVLVLYGRPFLPSVRPLLWLLPGILGLSLYGFLRTDVLGLGRPGLISLVSVGSMVVNLGLNLLLIPGHGATGAAVSSSVCYLLSSAVLLVFVSRKAGLPLGRMLLLRRDDRRLLRERLRAVLARNKEG